VIAIVCPIHKNPEVVAAQVANYASIHGSEAMHILHPSIESTDDFSSISADKNLNCRVLICEESLPTSYKSAIGAVISATREIKKYGNGISQVYYHSDADLLVSDGFVETLTTHKNGYRTVRIGETWHPYKAMIADEKFSNLRANLGIKNDDIRAGRIEGCFFEIDLWLEMVAAIERFFPLESLHNTKTFWPYEEVLFPTLAGKISRMDKPSSPNIVQTKLIRQTAKGKNVRDLEANMVQIADISALRSTLPNKKCVGMKWFSTDIQHPSRKYLKEVLAV